MAAKHKNDTKTRFYRKFSAKKRKQFENCWQFLLIFAFTFDL